MVVDLADGVMELPPRLLEELGVGLDAVAEGLDPGVPLLLAAHHVPPLLRRRRGRREPMARVLPFRRGGGLARVGEGGKERGRLGFRPRVAWLRRERSWMGRGPEEKRSSRWVFCNHRLGWCCSTRLSSRQVEFLGLCDPSLFLASLEFILLDFWCIQQTTKIKLYVSAKKIVTIWDLVFSRTYMPIKRYMRISQI